MGFWVVAVLPSPKSHSHEVTVPEEVVEPSENAAVGQVSRVCWKPAVVNGQATVTVWHLVSVAPVSAVTVKQTVYVPSAV